MARVAMPPMRRYGYSDRLAAGTIAAGGTLGILIPPSVVLVLYGILTRQDIGKLFLAGIAPGIVGVLGYMMAVRLLLWLSGEQSKPLLPLPLRERLQKLRGVELDTADRNIERARYLRRHLNKDNGDETRKN